jgi:hypothetical protein
LGKRLRKAGDSSMGRRPKESGSSLSIKRLLEESKKKDTLDQRKRGLERSGFAEWRIWKLLRINWR